MFLVETNYGITWSWACNHVFWLKKKNHGLTWSTMVFGQNKPIWNNMVNHVFGLNKPVMTDMVNHGLGS